MPDNIFLIGCIPDFPINRAALGGLVPHQWPPEERTEKEKSKLMWKWFQEWKKNQVF